MVLVDFLFSLFGMHPSIVSFFGAFIAGGETIIALSILSAQGIMPLWIVYVFCSLGMFCSDLLWFSLGKIRALSYFKKYKYLKKGYKKAADVVEKTNNPFILLTLTKFIYGIGIPAIMYLGRRKYTYKKFMVYNGAIILSWSTLIVFLGWWVGRGVNLFYKTYQNFQLAIFLLLIGILLIHLCKILFGKWFTKKEHIKNLNLT